MIETLQQNLNCLPPELRARILQAADGLPTAKYCTAKSRSGHLVTGKVIDGIDRFYHSIYDPVREAERLSGTAHTETPIVLGFGTGYHLAPLLRKATRLIVVEPDLLSIAYSLQRVDLTEVLSHPGLALVVGEATNELAGNIARAYIPAIHGSASVLALPGRLQAEPDGFAAMQNELRRALESVADDFAVQARFGRLWLRNTIVNLASLTSGTRAAEGGALSSIEYPDLRGRSVVVTAAGPSLTHTLSSLSAPSDSVLLATDTSLPSLTEAGLKPDAVVTVDCQAVSYLHYLTASFPDTLLLADLAVSPSVIAAHRRVRPLLSQHPLHRLLRALGANLPVFDSSGGNVTHAAVSLAVSLGAASVTVVGADFSYPNGESYARGSYAHKFFAVRASRTHPWSDALYHFAHDRPGVYRSTESPSTLRLPTLDRFRDALARLAVSAPIPVTMLSAQDLSSDGRPVATSAPRAPGANPIADAPRFVDASLPSNILHRLQSLFLDAGDLNDALLGRSSDRDRGDRVDTASTQAVAMALLPFVAWLRRVTPVTDAGDLLRAAHGDAIDLLSHFVNFYGAPAGGR